MLFPVLPGYFRKSERRAAGQSQRIIRGALPQIRRMNFLLKSSSRVLELRGSPHPPETPRPSPLPRLHPWATPSTLNSISLFCKHRPHRAPPLNQRPNPPIWGVPLLRARWEHKRPRPKLLGIWALIRLYSGEKWKACRKTSGGKEEKMEMGGGV